MEFKLTIPTDENGLAGRECPSCERYFKIKFGTGLKDPGPCHCPYCNHVAPHDYFWTKDQIKYAESHVLNYAEKYILNSLKKLETKPKRNQLISLEINEKERNSYNYLLHLIYYLVLYHLHYVVKI